MTYRTSVTPSGSPLAVTIRRGRSRFLDRFNPGVVTIVYGNENNDFPPFSSSVRAGTPIEIDFDDGVNPAVRMFTGQVWSATNDYPLGGRPTTTVTGRDTLDLFMRAREPIPAPANRPQELSGARLTAVANAIATTGVTLSTNFDAGNEMLTSSTFFVNATDNYEVLDAELGKLYADRSGVIQFRQRNQAGAPAIAATFSDDGVYLPFHDIGVSNGSDQIINVIEWSAGTNVIDNTSVATYGPSRKVLNQSWYPTFSTRAAQIGNYLINQYKTPTPRISSIGIDIHTLSDANAATVCALDINDQVRIIWTPPGTSQVDKAGVIESIEHQISIDQHRMVIGLTEPTGSGFTLDDNVYGILDQNQLGL